MILQAARLTATGIAIGVAAPLFAMQLLSTLLFGISPRDPWTLAGVSMVLVVAVGLATTAAPGERSRSPRRRRCGRRCERG